MKKYIMLLAFGFGTLLLPAQQKTDKAEVFEGIETPMKKSSLSEIVGSDETGYYIILTQKRQLLLQHLGKDLKVISTTEIQQKMDYQDTKRYYSGIVMLGKNMYMLSSVTFKEKKVTTTYIQKINKQTLAIEPTLQEIESFSYETQRGGVIIGGFGNQRRINDMISSMSVSPHVVSDDKSHILLYRNMGITRENPKEQIKMQVFDENFKPVWKSETELPYDAELFTLNYVDVDNKGNVYMTGVEYQDRKSSRTSRREGKPSYKYHLISYKDGGKKMRDYPVELSDNFITDVRIDIADNGDLVTVGFYSEKGSYSVKGAFYMTIDGESRQVKKQKTTAFETDFITQNMSEREKKKVERREAKGQSAELYEFDLDHLILQNDGGATLIAEQFFIEIQTVTTTNPNGGSSTRTIYHYYYNDLIALSFGPDGSLVWKVKVPKRQHTTNDGGYYSSYAYAAVGNKLYLLFNDNPKNLFLQPNERPHYSFGKEIAVSIVQIDANSGAMSRELLFTTSRGDITIRPKMCLQTGEREMLIYGERRRKTYQFSAVTFKK